MKTKLLAIAFAMLTFSAPLMAQSDAWDLDTAHSSAQFTVRHMMVANVRGDFGKVSGKVYFDGKDFSKARIEVVIEAASINTRNEARDKELMSPNFFDVAQYPKIEFKSKKVEQVQEGRLRVTGDLTMHGVTREVVLDVEGPTPEVKDQRGAAHIGASATTKINRKDFNILWNRTLDGGGVVVADEVLIAIDVELVKRPGQLAAIR
jgi:polyisoprenoid-binding protein YceI